MCKKFVIYTKEDLVLMIPHHFIVILQTFDRITLYPNDRKAGKVNKTSVLKKYKRLIWMIMLMKIK